MKVEKRYDSRDRVSLVFIYVVRLEDGTVGTAEDAEVGKKAIVKFHNENGMPVQAEGIVAEILDDVEG